MLTRRALVGFLFGLSGIAVAQKAIMEGKKAVVCDGEAVKCPLQHETCRVIDAPLVVGNDRRDYPENSQLFDYRVLVCDQCGILFTQKR